MKPGDKVVCVDDSTSKCVCCFGLKTPLILNNIYVVDLVGKAQNGNDYITVLGVVMPKHLGVSGFSPARFRLLDELKKENSIKNQTPQTIEI